MFRAILALLLTQPLLAQGIWEARARYPIAAWGASGAAIGGKLYVVSGAGGGSRRPGRSQLHIYDPVRDSWSRGADAPVLLVYANAAAAGGKLYILGAIFPFFDSRGSAVTEGGTYEYDPATDLWQKVAEMPTPRGASGVAAIGTKIYVAGGQTGPRVVADFEVFDTITRQWTRLPPLSSPRAFLTAQAVGGRFYAIGGLDAPLDVMGGSSSSVVEEFDPEATVWRPRAPSPSPLSGVASGLLDDRIIACAWTDSFEYDPAANTWRRLAVMREPRYTIYGLSLGNRVYFPAGAKGDIDEASDAHEVFFFPPSQKPRFPANGVVQAASLEPALSPGALVSLFGEALSLDEGIASRLPLSSTLASVSVRVAGRALPLTYVSSRQINFHLPYDLVPGPVTITVVNAGIESDPVSIPALVESAPGLFSLELTVRGQGAILIAGTGLLAKTTSDAFSRPARRGEVVEIYSTGLGRVDNPLPAGQPAPASLARTLVTPLVTVGGVRAEVVFSGLAPGLVGVYTIHVTVPASSPTGIAVPVEVRMSETGRPSNIVTMAVAE